jgi:serine/threonine-protein kinase
MDERASHERLPPGGGLGIYGDVAKDNGPALEGRLLGEYRVTGLIAEGGMSRVYSAERVDGSFQREVAIKLSPASGLSQGLRDRFLREQGILAGLNHPNISQLYDAQVTDEGWPYIVMELVDGHPIDQHCRGQKLDRDAIVDLMIQITDAVAFAHARLIVHRDIKPSNVLVTHSGSPKLLDFGIAKLLEPGATALTDASPLTPGYASPEQLLGKPITVASDIYQLGLLFFQLLVGQPVNADESLAQAIQRAAATKPLNFELLQQRNLPRDLRLIIQQCLRAAPEERYRGATALYEDLCRFRRGYPVSAAGQSAGYRFRKFITRNAAAAAVATVAVVTLAAGASWYTWALSQSRSFAEAERDEAQRQRGLAEQSLQFLVSIFQAASPERAQNAELTAREVIDAGAARLADEFAEQPEVQARLYSAIGDVYLDLGQLERSREMAQRAVALTQGLYGNSHPETLTALNRQAAVMMAQADYAGAEAIYQQLVDYGNLVDGPTDPRTVEARSNLATVYWYTGRIDEATPVLLSVYEIRVQRDGPDALTTIRAAYNYAAALQVLGDYEEVVASGGANLKAAEDALGPKHPMTLASMTILSAAYTKLKQYDRAEALMGDALSRSRQIYGEDHPETLNAKNNLAILYANTERFQLALDLLREVRQQKERVLGVEHPRTLQAVSNVGGALSRLKLYEEAVETLTAVIRTQERQLGPSHSDTLNSRRYLAGALFEAGDPSAEAYATELLADLEEYLGVDHPNALQMREAIEENRSSVGGN